MPALSDIGGIVASLRVLDEFSGPIKAALDQIADLEAALDRFKDASGGISRPFTRLSAAITKTEKPLADLAGRLDALEAPISTAADKLAGMQERSAAIAASATDAARAYAKIGTMRLPAVAGGEGFLAGRLSAMGGRLLSIPGLAAGATIYESMKQALSENLALTQTLSAFNIPNETARQHAAHLARLHAPARQSAIGTIYTEAETANAMLGAAQMSGFTGQQGIAQFASVFPIALRMAEVRQMQGLGSIAENIKAAIGFLMRAGLGRSAGFSIGQMILGVLTAGGPINAQLAQYRAAVDRALGKSAPKFQNLTAHVAALEDLGILNRAGRLTVVNKHGGVDIGKILADIQQYGAHHTQTDLADVLYKAFGIRGMRGATLLALQQSPFSQFQKLIAGTPGAAAQQAAFAQTPLQKFEQLLARLQDIGNVLATALLPELAVLLKYLDVLFGTIDRWLAQHSQATKVAAGARVGAMIAGPPGAVIGAGIGALAGTAATMPEGTSTPHHMIGAGKAAAALLGRPALPQGTQGDPLYVHPRGVLPAAPQITVNAPQNVTIHADGVTPQDVIRALREANQQFAEMVRLTTIQAFNQVQQHQKRRTFLDPGLGGAAP